MDPLIAIVAAVGVIGVIGYLVYLADKKRTEALQQYAQAHGLTFEGTGTDLGGWVQGFKLFNQGRSRQLKNVMRGAKERAQVALADYKYVTGGGKSSTTHRQTVCVVRYPGLHLPHFFVRRQVPLFDALGKMFGGQDLDFEEDPQFSKAYVLQSDEGDGEVRRYFNERARAHFLDLASKNVQVEGDGEVLLLHVGRQLKVEELDGLLADTVNVVRLWAPR